MGSTAIVRRVEGGRAVARRLMEMGLTPGTAVTVVRVAPLGDPLELRVRSSAVSIRRADADGVAVGEVRLPAGAVLRVRETPP